MMTKWLAIVGIGEDGWLGLSPSARALVKGAEIVVGGDRHLAMLPHPALGEVSQPVPASTGNVVQQHWSWASPMSDSIEAIVQHRGQSVCVLASGDPMCYGVGALLTRRIPLAEITILPAPSTFSWLCARLGWAFAEVETLSLCGRPMDLLRAVLYPGAKILILSADRHTPHTVATLLGATGFGESTMTVLERLGGDPEREIVGTAQAWLRPEWRVQQRATADELADLNAIAVECCPVEACTAESHPAESDGGKPTFAAHRFSRTPGLPDAAYHHDGQLTKQEVRAVTLAALAPQPGQLLWDVGAGCGSIGIEWMRSHPRCRAIAIEKARSHYIADNAVALGTPGLHLVVGTAPAALQDLPPPDAIFIGGGLTAPDQVATCWAALKPGGRLVANGVTLESEQVMFEWQQRVGGTLTRIAIQRAGAIGSFLGWKPLVPVTQWLANKPVR
jgi:precorrin-6B C5,15-methyltransferase / cobalt-precorrin-6B C5,C15-methyltransferase